MNADLLTRFPLFVEDEFELLTSCIDLEGDDLLDIGCGKGEFTRRLAVDGRARMVIGIEVDEVQLEHNMNCLLPLNLAFRRCAAEKLDFPDASFGSVLMFKSLHHVPISLMQQAFLEISRVLRPAGKLYVSEPVYAGPFNDIMQIFHDEALVRTEAIRTINWAVDKGLFRSERHLRFFVPIAFNNFEDFRSRMMNVTHSTFQLDSHVISSIQSAYEAHQAPQGARFIRPMRVDVLVKHCP